jgi:hypothetical protein
MTHHSRPGAPTYNDPPAAAGITSKGSHSRAQTQCATQCAVDGAFLRPPGGDCDNEPVSSSDQTRGRDQRDEILKLCLALRQAVRDLWLDPVSELELVGLLSAAETAAAEEKTDLDSVKAIRYILLESADGPLAPFMADAAARIIGDGFGKIFYRR